MRVLSHRNMAEACPLTAVTNESDRKIDPETGLSFFLRKIPKDLIKKLIDALLRLRGQLFVTVQKIKAYSRQLAASSLLAARFPFNHHRAKLFLQKIQDLPALAVGKLHANAGGPD